MTISFACPECQAKIEVGAEHAGHAGQCPRCQNVIVIPSPTQGVPAKTKTIPPTDPWEERREQAKPKRRASEAEESPARRRRTAAPKPPAGPMWPWVLGVAGAFVVATLLFSSLIVLVFWRRTELPRPAAVLAEVKPPIPAMNHGVTVGRLEGQHAFMQDGVFQVRSALNPNDPPDPLDATCRVKRFEIDLRNDRIYVLEQDSDQFDSFVRVEDFQGKMLGSNGDFGIRNARMQFQPQRAGVYVVFASSVDPAFGNFTLTIRERDAPKPFVP
jgi:hypothetical protein